MKFSLFSHRVDSYAIEALWRQPPSKEEILSCISSSILFSSFKEGEKQAKEQQMWAYITRYNRVLNSWVQLSLVARRTNTFANHHQTNNRILSYYLSSCALQRLARFYTEQRDIHHVLQSASLHLQKEKKASQCCSSLYIFDMVLLPFLVPIIAQMLVQWRILMLNSDQELNHTAIQWRFNINIKQCTVFSSKELFNVLVQALLSYCWGLRFKSHCEIF